MRSLYTRTLCVRVIGTGQRDVPLRAKRRDPFIVAQAPTNSGTASAAAGALRGSYRPAAHSTTPATHPGCTAQKTAKGRQALGVGQQVALDVTAVGHRTKLVQGERPAVPEVRTSRVRFGRFRYVMKTLTVKVKPLLPDNLRMESG